MALVREQFSTALTASGMPEVPQEFSVVPRAQSILRSTLAEIDHFIGLDEIATAKAAFVFKPAHGFASHGVGSSAQVGKAGLRHLLRKGSAYVAQKVVAKPTLRLEGAEGNNLLWTDLRVWAYRGERYLISGRASKQPNRLDLAPRGGAGW